MEVALYEEREGEENREEVDGGGVDRGGADVVEAEDLADGDKKLQARTKVGQRQ